MTFKPHTWPSFCIFILGTVLTLQLSFECKLNVKQFKTCSVFFQDKIHFYRIESSGSSPSMLLIPMLEQDKQTKNHFQKSFFLISFLCTVRPNRMQKIMNKATLFSCVCECVCLCVCVNRWVCVCLCVCDVIFVWPLVIFILM